MVALLFTEKHYGFGTLLLQDAIWPPDVPLAPYTPPGCLADGLKMLLFGVARWGHIYDL